MITALIIVFLVKFQSTLPRRERQSLEIYLILLCNFNPHSHEGSDVHHIVPISTDYTFQSTLPRRERHIYHIGLTPCALFQSTLPRRERLPFLSKFPFLYDFNPHSHEGSDTGKVPIYCGNFISIHTPTKGATEICSSKICWMAISIHTPTKGATRQIQKTANSIKHFNPHSHEGSDQFATLYISSVQNFNPHSHEGSDSNINQ